VPRLHEDLLRCLSCVTLKFNNDDDKILLTQLAVFTKQSLLKFLSSNLGLLGIVIIYAIGGGLIFEQLESTNEKNSCLTAESIYQPIEDNFVQELWQV